MKNICAKPTNFYPYVEHVINWNKTGNIGMHNHSNASIERQRKFVKEEYEELLIAIKEDNKVEFVDALADLVVTVGYWLFLKEPETITKNCTLNSFNFGANHIKNLQLAIDNEEPYNALQEVMALFYQTDCLVDKVMWEVLKSNDSKYPPLQDYRGEDVIYAPNQDFERTWTPEEMCEKIENRYKGRYTGVTYKVFEGKVIFKDDNLKIVKPITFEEPNLKSFC